MNGEPNSLPLQDGPLGYVDTCLGKLAVFGMAEDDEMEIVGRTEAAVNEMTPTELAHRLLPFIAHSASGLQQDGATPNAPTLSDGQVQQLSEKEIDDVLAIFVRHQEHLYKGATGPSTDTEGRLVFDLSYGDTQHPQNENETNIVYLHRLYVLYMRNLDQLCSQIDTKLPLLLKPVAELEGRMVTAKPTLEEIRQGLTKFKAGLLSEVWQAFQNTGEWPTLRTLFSRHGKMKVKEALSSLGGSVGHEERTGNSRWARYQLSLLGVLLTPHGDDFQRLLARFLCLQRNLFVENPTAETLTSEVIAARLKLTSEQTALLGQLVWLSHLGGSFKRGTGQWMATAMEEAENFPENDDLSAQVEEMALRFYDQQVPVFAEDQHRSLRTNIALISPGVFDPGTSEEPQPRAVVSHPPEIAVSIGKLRDRYPNPNRLGFLIMRFNKESPFPDIIAAIKSTAEKYGLAVMRADEKQFHANLFENVQTFLHGCGFGIAIYERISKDEPNANVGLEVGYLMAMGKPVLLLKDKTLRVLQTDLAGKLYREFDPHNAAGTIPEELDRWFADNGIVVPGQT